MTVRRRSLSQMADTLGDRPIDAFVGSVSFEERCLSIPRRVDTGRVGDVFIGCNGTYRSTFQANYDAVCELFGEHLTILELFSDDPVGSARNIGKALSGRFVGSPKRVVMDITTFTRESLLMLLLFFRLNMRTTDTLELLYVRAKEYSVGSEEGNEWLSKGVLEVRSVLGYPGQMSASRPTHLIVMVGFEFDRAVEIVNWLEPSFVSLGFADPIETGTRDHQRTNEAVVGRLRRTFGDVESFQFRAYDANGTKTDLRKQVERRLGCNVVVAPMHTKISTVGASLLACEDDRIQLCYAPAKIYNVEHYSIPGDEFYWLMF